jgi:hypothetical protein
MTPNPTFMALGCAIGTVVLTSVLCILYWEGLSLILVVSQARDDGCSMCQRGVIERVAATSTGDRFYLCHSCGARYRRSSRGGLYQDASAPKFDRVFLRRTREGTFEKAVLPPIEEEFRWTRTIDALVWCKRSRFRSEFKRMNWGVCRDTEYGSPLWDRELDLRTCELTQSGSPEV